MIGRLAQQRLDRPQIIQDALQLTGGFAIRIAGPGRQARHQDLSRSAEQDDQIEARMESDLVLLTSSDEEQVGVFGSQELADGVLAPPLASVRQRLAPSVVGVDGLYPRAASAWTTLDFPVPDIPVSNTRFTATSLRPRGPATSPEACGRPLRRRRHPGRRPAAVMGHGAGLAGQRLFDDDDDLALGVPIAEIPQGFGHLAQRVAAVNDRGDLSRLAELHEGCQTLRT